MRRVCQLVLVVGAAALLASPVVAQQRPGGGRFGGMGGGMPTWILLSQKSVQDELKLTEDQIKRVDRLAQKQREAFQTLGDVDQAERGKKMQEMNKANEKAAAEILKPEQAKRLKQISLQVTGARAFNNPEVAKELKLTDEQKDKIKAIQKETAEEANKIRENATDRAEARKKTEQLTKSANEKVMGLLTAEQKDKWKAMTGELFKGEIRFGFPGGGRPGR